MTINNEFIDYMDLIIERLERKKISINHAIERIKEIQKEERIKINYAQ